MKNWLGILVIIAGVCAAAAGGGAATSEGVRTWYPTLEKPAWNPPNWVFGPVWSVLYAMMALAASLVWVRRPHRFAAPALTLFGLQLAANFAWSWFFFAMQDPRLALGDISLLWVLIAGTGIMFWKVRPAAGWLLVPYFLWVSYAATLNAGIVYLNP